MTMPVLDFTTPFDELTELRSVLSAQEIADLTGLRRETISRADSSSHFRPRTERAFTDLNTVVKRLLPRIDGNSGQLAAVLKRPQPSLADLSIAELIRDGKVERVLEHLEEPARDEAESDELQQLRNFRLAPEVVARLRVLEAESSPPDDEAVRARDAARAEALVARDPELAARLPEIESKVREHFGPEVRIERCVCEEPETDEDDDRLHLRAFNGLSFEQNLARLRALLKQEADLLDPVADRLTIGFL